MNLFRKKCEYCKEKIENGKELFRDVKDPAFIRTRKKTFCCKEHADNFESDVKECCKNSKGRGCCG